MLTVLHILGNEPHESLQRNIYDESAFFMRHGVDVRFVYDPSSRLATETNFIDSLHELKSLIYKLPYLPQATPDNPTIRQGHRSATRKGGYSAFRAALTLREMCTVLPVDIIHTHTEPAYKLACAARFLGAPVVHIFTAHAVTAQFAPDYLYNRLLSYWCDEFIAIDGYTAGILLDRLIRVGKIKRVNYGVDFSKWGKSINGGAGRIGGADGAGEAGGAGGMYDTGGAGGMYDAGGAGEAGASGAAGGISAPGKTGDDFTLLMISDSDPIGDGTVYDIFTDLILRLMHDYNPSSQNYRRLRFIIATNSEYGLRYSRELIKTLDLNDNVIITSLSGNDDLIISGGAEDSDGGGIGGSGGIGGGVFVGGNGDEIGSGGSQEESKTAWSKVKADNWVESEAKIKLRSFKYKASNEINKYEAHSDSGAIKLFGMDCESFRRELYSQADMCICYSENRFFPYPAVEAIASGIPTMTNDQNFISSLLPPDVKNSAGSDDNNIPTVSFAYANFDDPNDLAGRILALISDGTLREDFIALEDKFVRSRYDIEDMIIGIYDSYVRGLRV